MGFPGRSGGKESAWNAGDLGWEDPLEEGMATHSSILAWRIPWTEEPGGLSPRGHKKQNRHDWATPHSTAQYGAWYQALQFEHNCYPALFLQRRRRTRMGEGRRLGTGGRGRGEEEETWRERRREKQGGGKEKRKEKGEGRQDNRRGS